MRRLFQSLLRWVRGDLFRRLAKNVSILYSGTFVASLLGLVSLPLSVRLLGPYLFGLFVLIQWYERLFDALINFQSWQVVIKYGAEAIERNDEERLKQYIKVAFLIDAISAVAGAIIAILLVRTIGSWLDWDERTIRLARIFSIAIAFRLTGTSEGILRLFGRFVMFSVQSVLGSAIKLAGIVVLVLIDAQGNLEAFVYVTLFSVFARQAFLGIATIIELRRRGLGGWLRVPTTGTRDFLRFAIWSNLQLTVHIPLQEFDKILVSQIISVEAVGVYQVFKQFGQVLSKVTTPIYQAIFPELSSMIAAGRQRTAAITTAKAALLFLFAAAIPVAVLAGTSPWWLNRFFGAVFASYWMTFALYLVIRTVSSAAAPIDPLFISFGFVRYKFFISLAVSVVYIAVAWYLCHVLDLTGMVLSYGIQMFSLYAIMILVMYTKHSFRDAR